jgi:hypothetical protein
MTLTLGTLRSWSHYVANGQLGVSKYEKICPITNTLVDIGPVE